MRRNGLILLHLSVLVISSTRSQITSPPDDCSPQVFGDVVNINKTLFIEKLQCNYFSQARADQNCTVVFIDRKGNGMNGIYFCSGAPLQFHQQFFLQITDCPAIDFAGQGDDLGDINLKTYRYTHEDIIFFAQVNLTFSKIKWKRMLFNITSNIVNI